MPKRTDIEKILLIGSGPIVIGQACEFDYSGSQACKALREDGYHIALVNNNPATIMTDPEMADRTYIEPLDAPKTLEQVVAAERPDALLPTLGGQTGLNLAVELAEAGVLGQARRGADRGEAAGDPKSGEPPALQRSDAQNRDGPAPEAAPCAPWRTRWQALDEIPFPLILRPGFTLSGKGGGIAYNIEEYREMIAEGLMHQPDGRGSG